MPGSAQQCSSTDLLDQACEWAVRLRADSVHESDLEQFADWLADSDAHRQAFDKVAVMVGDLGAVAAMPVDHLTPEPQRRGWFSWPRLTGALTAVAVATTALLLIPVDVPVDTYRTAVGEQRQIELADGSRVELNTDSALSVQLGDDRRQLHLIRGEVYFEVAKDQRRPFVVNLDGATAQALGTAFNIYRDHRGLATVTVTEGTVKVAEDKRRSESTILRADEAAAYHPQQGIEAVTSANPKSAVAWRQQQMVFDNTPLHQVIDTLNRYSPTPIQLVSSDAALMPVSGVFSTKYPQDTALAVAEVLALDAKVDVDKVRLYKRDNRI